MVYFSGRKVSSSRGGAICTNNIELYNKMKDLVPLYEGFLTYGGISIREIEAMTVGLYETLDEDVVGQSPSFINYAAMELDKLGIPVIMPGGALGCHVDAKQFLSHVPQADYPAGALVAAFYIISGVRGMERGTMSSIRDEQGNDILADLELMRLAFPRRVFTLSQVEYLIDRLNWLYLTGNWLEESSFMKNLLCSGSSQDDAILLATGPKNLLPNSKLTLVTACKKCQLSLIELFINLPQICRAEMLHATSYIISYFAIFGV